MFLEIEKSSDILKFMDYYAFDTNNPISIEYKKDGNYLSFHNSLISLLKNKENFIVSRVYIQNVRQDFYPYYIPGIIIKNSYEVIYNYKNNTYTIKSLKYHNIFTNRNIFIVFRKIIRYLESSIVYENIRNNEILKGGIS